MYEINKNINVGFKPSTKEIAELFAKCDADEQAEIFNHIADIVSKWDNPFVFQLQNITDSKLLSDGGRKVMSEIGLYSSPT